MKSYGLAVLGIAAILAVSLIGVGLAYQASTENVDNEVKAAYITASLGGEATDYINSFGGNTFVFDYAETVDTTDPESPAVMKTLTFSGVIDKERQEIDIDEDVGAYPMGTATLTISMVGDEALPEALTLTVTPTGLNLTSYDVYMKVGSGDAQQFVDDPLHFDLTGSGASMDVSVTVFAALKEDVELDPESDIPQPYDVGGADFAFSVTETA